MHFLDDDDWILPGALSQLYRVACASNADWVYGTSRLVDKDGNLLTEHHIGVDGNAFTPVMAGEWLPIQASLIKSERFFEVGCFDPHLTVCQDKDICRKVALRGDLASTRNAVVCITRDRQNTTTPYDRATAYSIWSRDNILDEKGSFTRMRSSARTPFWRGRMVRAYLTCVIWNLRKGKILKASSRTLGAVAALAVSPRYVVSPEFWRALIINFSRKNVE